MVLEATVICVDNSDYARNGDFVPTRLLAQQDAVSLVCHSKKSNAENTVGLICMAGAEVLVTLSPDAQKVMSRLQAVQPRGNIQFGTSILIAHLTLRHRQSRNQRMRIVAFVGSPILEDEKDLVRLGKRLKKENVSLDVVNFGEEETNQAKLTAMLDAVNGKDGTGSHLVTVTAGSMLHDSLMVSPIIVGEDGAGSLPAGYGGGYEFDVQDDPELALALRVSMEEQRARQEQQNANQDAGGGGGANSAGSLAAGGVATGTADAPRSAEEAMLARAMGGADTGASMDTDIDMLAGMTEEEQIAMALRMSLQTDMGSERSGNNTAGSGGEDGSGAASAASRASEPAEGPLDPPSKKIKVDPSEAKGPAAAAAAAAAGSAEDDAEVLEDPEFLESVLQGLPGVDSKSAEVQEALQRSKKKRRDGDGGAGAGGSGAV